MRLQKRYALHTPNTVIQVCDDQLTFARMTGTRPALFEPPAPLPVKSPSGLSMHWKTGRLRGSLARCNIIRSCYAESFGPG